MRSEPTMRLVALAFACLASAAGPASAQARYQLPPKPIVDILDAKPLPTATVSPTRQDIALLERSSMPAIAEVSQPMLRLAGARINPRTNGPHRAIVLTGITVQHLADGLRARGIEEPLFTSDGPTDDMLQGGGKLFAGSGGRVIGPGHFGLLDLGEGVQKFSCHFEADLDRGGASVVDIRPLLWKDGWPIGGDNVWEGTYEIQSQRSGGALELGVDFEVGGQAVLGRQDSLPTPWLTERHGYDPT